MRVKLEARLHLVCGKRLIQTGKQTYPLNR